MELRIQRSSIENSNAAAVTDAGSTICSYSNSFFLRALCVLRGSRFSLLTLLLLPWFAQTAFAHVQAQAQAAPLSVSWNGDWWLWLLVAFSGWLYVHGLWRLWRAAAPEAGVSAKQAAAFAAGWLTLVLALLSPLDALGGALFSAHMVQHELLMIVAAPLLILGHPLGPYIWALPRRWRQPAAALVREIGLQRAVRFLTRPLPAWILGAAALWLWHIPRLFDAALTSEGIHTLQHLSFFVTALLFWWSVISTRTAAGGYGAAVMSVVTTALHTSLLGALLTFAATPWYHAYERNPMPWGLTAIEDQQLGGLIMWIPGGLVYLAATLALMAVWLRVPQAQRV
jgi:putative membrane protein